eukprot:1472610-Lingulodinium_polyedra.AAC.1
MASPKVCVWEARRELVAELQQCPGGGADALVGVIVAQGRRLAERGFVKQAERQGLAQFPPLPRE